MRIEIHDVDHGGCAVITGPEGHRLMLDCGLNFGRSWFPSIAYRGQRIDTLMMLNLDRDHCEDLPYVWEHCPLGAIVSNPTVSAKALRAMKAECGTHAGVSKAIDILESYGEGMIGDWSHGLGGVHWHAFWNRYGADFIDTNNLSLAVFVQFGGFTILFGGDMERAGWRKLLTFPAFRDWLMRTNVYVASHHGRDNGCCEELFELCKPELIIFSDGPKQYESQETHGWYSSRASGIPDRTRPATIFGPARRRVMTTRKDGTITISVELDGQYLVSPSGQGVAFPPSASLASLFKPTRADVLSNLALGQG